MNIVHSAYVAGRISRQDEVRAIIAFLKAHGLSVPRDWTWTDALKSEADAENYRQEAYRARSEHYAQESSKDIHASITADVFIILSDELGSSIYVELGAALASHVITGTPRFLYVIGPYFDRSLHYQHPSVTWVESRERIIEDLKKRGIL